MKRYFKREVNNFSSEEKSTMEYLIRYGLMPTKEEVKKGTDTYQQAMVNKVRRLAKSPIWDDELNV